MDYEDQRRIEERWAYEHSPQYLKRVAIEKMRAQRERDGPSLVEIAKEFLPRYT